MGILGAIGDFLTGTYHEDYERGSNWAERVYSSGNDVDHDQASYLADEYGTDPEAFYDGFRDTYNDYVKMTQHQDTCKIGHKNTVTFS